MEKKVLVSQAERRWLAENAVIEMGSRVKVKVLNLDIAVERLRGEREKNNLSPYIELQPISEDLNKNRSKMATFQKDPLTNVLYGIALSADEFGNIRWQKIQINDMMSLNLDNLNDARIWTVLRFSPDILYSPFQGQNPYYKIYDPVSEAQVEQMEVLAIKKAFERVDTLLKKPKQMVQFARYMGNEVRDNTNYEIILGTLLSDARNRPALFNKRWESRARSFAEHFHSALALGIVTENVDRGFMYEGIALGMSVPDAIRFLSKEKTVMSSISTALDERDEAVLSVNNTMIEKKEVVQEVEEDNDLY